MRNSDLKIHIYLTGRRNIIAGNDTEWRNCSETVNSFRYLLGLTKLRDS